MIKAPHRELPVIPPKPCQLPPFGDIQTKERLDPVCGSSPPVRFLVGLHSLIAVGSRRRLNLAGDIV